MLEPCPVTVQLAAQVVGAERGPEGSIRPLQLAQHFMKRLYPRISRLVGAAGFDALMARSLALAQQDRPSLATVSAGPGGTLLGLDACVRSAAVDPEAALEIISRFLELMRQLVGDDLTLQLLHEAGRGDGGQAE